MSNGRSEEEERETHSSCREKAHSGDRFWRFFKKSQLSIMITVGDSGRFYWSDRCCPATLSCDDHSLSCEKCFCCFRSYLRHRVHGVGFWGETGSAMAKREGDSISQQGASSSGAGGLCSGESQVCADF